jgi:hypothetical protein
VRSHKIFATARPTVPKPASAIRQQLEFRASEFKAWDAASGCVDEVLCNVLGKVIGPGRSYHDTCARPGREIESALRLTAGNVIARAPLVDESPAGGLPGRTRIKVGNIMRSHRNQGNAFLRGITRGTLFHGASPCRAPRSAATPGYGGEWMIRKFANASALALLSCAILLGAQAFAQTTPAAEPPAAQEPAGQQPADQQPADQQPAAQQPPAQQPAATATASDQEVAEESSSRRKPKPKDYKNWTYNVGIGASLESGATKTFVRQGGYQGTFGIARNANKYLGLRADFFAADLPLRQSALSLGQAGSASSYLLALTVGPIINIPVTKDWSGYLVFGPGFYHRGGSLNDDAAIPGSTCNAFFQWWDGCTNISIPLNGSFVNADQNEVGYNFGGGITRKTPSGVEIYAEFRLMHGRANNTTTDVRPITIGVRW